MTNEKWKMENAKVSYELFIALRYLRARRRYMAVSVITAIAVTGIAVGVAALIIAQSMIAGFRADVQDKILQGTAHLNLLKENNSGIEDYRQLIDRIEKIPGISHASATLYAPVLIIVADRQEHVIIKGVDMSVPREANEIFSTILEGNPEELMEAAVETGNQAQDSEAPQKIRGIILGRQLANTLGVKIGESLTAISAISRLTPTGLQTRPSYTKFRITGIFSSGLYEYDAKWSYASLQAAQEITGSGDTAGVVQMKVSDIYAVNEIGAQVSSIAGKGFITTNWQELNRPLFAALKLQHRVIVIFFALLIAIASLNIITTLTMMVVEKNRDIAILRAQGATAKNIRRIFIFQGGIIGIIGSLMGLILGVGLSRLVNAFELISLPAEFYAISHITLKIDIIDCAGIALLSILICLLATIYPSRFASRLTPVEALRYE